MGRSAALLVLVACLGLVAPGLVYGMGECYNPKTGDPQVCLPPFVNAAFGKTVEATNTCGLNGPEEYCLQTGATGVTKSCHYCSARDPWRHYNASYLTDLSKDNAPTWWQSQTMVSDVQHPSMVNLTLNLGKAFDITYVRLKFHSSRPESFSIYKKTCNSCDWESYQYYSGTCYKTYGLDNREFITVEDEKKALCTEDYSDISPLTGGNVAFSTLEGRPSAYNFDKSTVLQDWVTAVAIRISLNRINTFGDEVFSDSKILKNYYYAISDFAVGGRCKCSGHASECILSDTGTMVCVCEHNTIGDDCELCKPLYNDAPWKRGGDSSPHVCQACDCNGLADSCEFDAELYRRTGHGGRCIGCRDNTAGIHCELCLPNHYGNALSGRCVSCACSRVGSVSEQCDEAGQCTCKPGVGGERCDQCLSGYHGLTEAGCSVCQCSAYGTEVGTVCDPISGACVCKLNVEGINCDRCKPGSMNLQYDNPYGCTACFCHGHSSICEVAGGYTVTQIRSDFIDGEENWRAVDSGGSTAGDVTWGGEGKIGLDGLYFSAPAKYLGIQRFSYNQFFEFVLSEEEEGESLPFDAVESSGGTEEILRLTSGPRYGPDLIIEGDQYRVTMPLNGQNNPDPSSEPQMYRYRLHEAAGFSPRLSAFQFQKMLNDVKSIRIRATNNLGATYLHSVKLDSAEEGGTGPDADWIERCIVEGYLDLSASGCRSGYTRETANGGVYSACVPCDCNGHGTECDPETGVCECLDNFAGEHCEICAVGYYMDDKSCVPCPCPNKIACARTVDGVVKCLSCPPGHYGNHCKFCMDGWFGVDTCHRCTCNGNIDLNAIMNCDRVTGECLKCIYNTTGPRCEKCLDGHYGDPLSDQPDERCRACECYSLGSADAFRCDRASGKCSCLPNVVGKNCDQCQDGYWDLHSGEGCIACGCDSIGATTGKCDQDSGQCDCLPGVTGQRCDRCMDNYYHLTREGCEHCECSIVGSANLQCNEEGKCVCKEGVLGMKCDQCQENYYDLSSGCIECPPCYGLVQDAVGQHRRELDRLSQQLANIGDRRPTNGGDFEDKLNALKETVEETKKQANDLTGKRNSINDKVSEVNDRIRDLVVKVAMVETNVDSCASRVEEANRTMNEAEQTMQEIDRKLEKANNHLSEAAEYINQAKAIALDSVSKEDNMTKLADEADAIADQHQQESEAIVATAQTALDTSNNAKSAIQDAINTLNLLIDAFDVLSDTRLPRAIELRDDLANFSADVLAKTRNSKSEAIELLTEAEKLAQSIPDYNTEELDLEIQLIVQNANEFTPEVSALDEEYMDGHLLLQADIDRARSLLSTADAIQDTTDMLTAQAHSARETAVEAVGRGDAAYQSLLGIEQALRGFSGQIEDNRALANEALENVEAIQGTVESANRKTNETRGALGSARDFSERARGKAQNAQSIAQDVQRDANQIRNEADAAQVNIEQVQNNVNGLDGSVVETEGRLAVAEGTTNASTKAVDEAAKEATNAKNKADAAKNKVDDLLARLRQLVLQLDDFHLPEGEMPRLQDQLDEIMRDADEANIQSSINELKAAADAQAAVINKYDRELALLRADVQNLRQINETLPIGCFSEEPGVELP